MVGTAVNLFCAAAFYSRGVAQMMLSKLGIAVCALAAVMVAGAPAAAQETRWRTVLELPSANIAAMTYASGETAWAAGSGAIFRSGDGGRTWSTATLLPTSMNDIEAAPDGVHGWAAGYLGTLFVTSDGGISWRQVAAGTEVNLTEVESFDDRTLLSAGIGYGFADAIVEPQPATFRRSIDAGVTWSEVPLDGYRVTALDALEGGRHAWAAAERCGAASQASCVPFTHRVFSSSDAGVTWAQVSSARITELSFTSSAAGWGVEQVCEQDYWTCESRIVRTLDGGRSWEAVRDAGATTVAAIDAESEQAATMALSECGSASCSTSVERTSDGGRTWDPVVSYPQFATDVAVRDQGTLLALRQGIQVTTDGSSWLPAEFPLTTGSGAFDFVDPDTGWFSASKLLRTDDGGATFEEVSAFRPDRIDFVSAMDGWATSLRCDVDCMVEIHRTRDGGTTWDLQHVIAAEATIELRMIDATEGWAFAQSGSALWRTTDGGANWSEVRVPDPQTSSSSSQPYDFSTSSAWLTRAVCEPGFSGCSAVVLRSIDGGATWNSTSPPPTASDDCGLQVTVLNETSAWIRVGRCGIGDRTPALLRTQDGGESWQTTTFAEDGWLHALQFFGENLGRGVRNVCVRGTGDCEAYLIRTDDGGASWSHELIPGAGNTGAKFLFVTPELLWSGANSGVWDVASQRLDRYEGAPLISPPATGQDGTTSGSHVRTLVLSAAAVTLLVVVASGVAIQRRRSGGREDVGLH